MHDPLVGANAAGNPTLKSYNMISSSVGSALSLTCFYPFSLTQHIIDDAANPTILCFDPE